MLDRSLGGRGGDHLQGDCGGCGYFRLVTREAAVHQTAIHGPIYSHHLLDSLDRGWLGGIEHRPWVPTAQDEAHRGGPEVVSVLLVQSSGLLVAHASRDFGVNPVIFAGMLTAVDTFVQDSFQDGLSQDGQHLSGLRYGPYRIVLERGPGDHYLVVVIRGNETPELAADLEDLRRVIGTDHGDELRDWDGDFARLPGIEAILAGFVALTARRNGHRQARLYAARMEDLMFGITNLPPTGPVILVLEDPEWCDQALMNTLRRLTTGWGRVPGLIIKATPGERGRDDGVGVRVIRDFAFFNLGPVRGEEVVSLIASMLGGSGPEDPLGQRLHRECAHHPIYIAAPPEWPRREPGVSREPLWSGSDSHDGNLMRT